MSIGEQKDYVTISKEEYKKLLDDQHFLDCLQAVGVDNWEGYEEALVIYTCGNNAIEEKE